MLADVLQETTTITGFVLAMMLVVEYLNVFLHGDRRLRALKGSWRQYALAGVLGVLPGCLGPWAVVTLYSHGLLTLGAMVTAMIATSGDEAYVMLAMIPERALLLFGGLLVFGVVVGLVTDFLVGRSRFAHLGECAELTIHPEASCELLSFAQIREQWKECSAVRGVLGAVFAVLLVLGTAGVIGPEEWDWVRVALFVANVFAVYVVATVPDHFLEDHLWGHVLRRHAARIFLWTLAALVLAHLIIDVISLDALGPQGLWTLLIVACLIGIIPESGPHLVFLTLYAKGAAPMSVLLASSIVQDGHGMLPLLAESRRAFILTKAVNFIAGLGVGAAALSLGF
ncbi:MAG: hypothetical protein GY953_10695 [bacterium]|nr:hypothetical protein [bacterium]